MKGYELRTLLKASRVASRNETKISTPYPTRNPIASGVKGIPFVKSVKRPTTKPPATAIGKRA
jgi:hypothetical protein